MSLGLGISPALALRPGIVDVWWLPLGVGPGARSGLLATLEPDEQVHRERLRIGGEHWALARALRRRVLSAYVGVTPARLRFASGPWGKPWLVGHDDLRFSSSSRAGLTLLTVAHGLELGADLEHEGSPLDPELGAAEWLPPHERAWVALHPAPLRRAAFLQAWTRFEAVRKLHGTGLGAAPPAQASDAPVVVRRIAAPAGYHAALAARGGTWRACVRDLAELRLEV